jgi:hypothetical protein
MQQQKNLRNCVLLYHNYFNFSFFNSEYKSNYGASTSLSGDPKSVTYCVHGKLAKICCDVENGLNIKKLDGKLN